MGFYATIVISTALGALLGSLAYDIKSSLQPTQNTFPHIELAQPILLSNNHQPVQGQEIPFQQNEMSKLLSAEIKGEEKVEVEPTPTALPEPTIIPSPSPQDIKSEPTPTPAPGEPDPTNEPEVLAAQQTEDLSADVIFNLINQHRNKLGLASFEKDTRLCSLAQSRAPELANEFKSGYLHKGLYDRHLSYWITENMIQIQTEQQAMNWWLNSSVHRAAIQGSYTYSCGACSGYSCAELFTSFVPKN